MGFLEPDRYFSRISKIDVERDLLDCGLRFALLDVDNTIRSRATGDMPRDVGFWLARARSRGISFCLVSNNWHDDIFTFANRLSLPVVAKAMKPLPPGYIMGMKRIGGTRADTVVIGDQLSTDVVGAHAVGLRAYLVQPLVEQDLRHTKALRRIERSLLGDRAPEGAPGSAAAGGTAAAVGADGSRGTAAPRGTNAAGAVSTRSDVATADEAVWGGAVADDRRFYGGDAKTNGAGAR